VFFCAVAIPVLPCPARIGGNERQGGVVSAVARAYYLIGTISLTNPIP